MKIRLVLALVALAISFALPAVAKEKETVDPQIRQQIDAINTKYDEAFDKHDAASIAALFAKDADIVPKPGLTR